jgi:pimeloyl-ACP methyl ester carboxylesterase
MNSISNLVSWAEKRGAPSAATLVLLFHGMDCGPETISGVADKIAAAVPDSYILVPALPFRWHDCADLKEVGEEVLDYIDSSVPLEGFKSILLVGHSAGGVLAQATYILSRHGEHLLGKFPPEKIRLVLIAPLSRGWKISHHLPLSNKIAWKLGLAVIPVVKAIERVRSIVQGRRAQEPWILQLQRGAPFLVWMRLAWLELPSFPEVFVLLGSIDEIISWRDMVDEVNGPEAVHLQVPYSDHVRIIDFGDTTHGEKRAGLIAAAVTLNPAEARILPESIEPWDEDPRAPNLDVKRVLFVIHGIRDEGHWTQKIGALARAFYAEAGLESRKQIRVITSSYGYFSMLEFLTSRSRLLKIHWLMDQYVEARRRFPEADFSFIGHSNGTYLIAQALKLYPEVKFERIAFAGSVVSSRFDWAALREQVSHVLNFTATNDWVVALFPRLADVLPMTWAFGPNLGGAGIEAFRETEGSETPTIRSNDYVKGEHSAAIHEDNWAALARFAVAKAPVIPPEDPREDSNYSRLAAWYFRGRIGRAAAVVTWIFLVTLLLLYLPWLAWMNPKAFWISPLILVIGCCVAIAVNQGRRTGVSLAKRKQIDSVSARLVGVLAGGLLLGLFWSVVLVAKEQWIAEFPGALRMLSVLVYLWLLFKGLTRV